MHSLDHLQRLHERAEEDVERAHTAGQSKRMNAEFESLVEIINSTRKNIDELKWDKAVHDAKKVSDSIYENETQIRQDILADVTSNTIDVPESTHELEAIRWMVRVSKHLERISHHISTALVSLKQD